MSDTTKIDEKTKAWVEGVGRSEGGDRERAAKWLRKLVRCTIGEARAFIAQAIGK